jgi:ATP-dependent Lhr-like helicase
MSALTRIVPVSIMLRSDVEWLRATRGDIGEERLSSAAQQVLEVLSQEGALFAADLLSRTDLLPAQLDEALGELIARGRLTADGFGGLRKMIGERRLNERRRRPGVVRKRAGSGGSGRWSLWRTRQLPERNSIEARDAVEQWAWQLLRRWGVVFRDLLTRETGAPRWFELLQVYRRLEARGEIRGGRFIAGVAGEQFALGESVRMLRELRDSRSDAANSQGQGDEESLETQPQEALQELVVVSAADPLNLAGILTNDPRVPATASNRVAYLNGKPVAAKQGGEWKTLNEFPPELTRLIAERFGLTGRAMPRQILAAPTAVSGLVAP